jgi:hypothetical protein
VYNIEASKGEYAVIGGTNQVDFLTESLKKNILSTFNAANEYKINHFSYDSLRRNDRNEFLLFADGVVSRNTKPISLKSYLTNTNTQAIFPCDPIAMSPEILNLIGKEKQKATVLLSLIIYYQPTSPLGKFGLPTNGVFANAAIASYSQNAISTCAIMHILDYKKKRIIQKVISISSANEDALYNDLKKIYPSVYEALEN